MNSLALLRSVRPLRALALALLLSAALSARAVESLVVTTTADENDGTSDPAVGAGTSLREAVARANSDGVDSTITFEPTVFGSVKRTITLTLGEMPLQAHNGRITIRGPFTAGAGVTISAGGVSRHFTVGFNANADLQFLTLRDGRATLGGSIHVNGGNLSLVQSALVGNSATVNGGAIYSDAYNGQVAAVDCTMTGNTSPRAGAIYNSFGRFYLDSCTISGNSFFGIMGSGADFDDIPYGVFRVRNCIISGNTYAADTADDMSPSYGSPYSSEGYNLLGQTALAKFVSAGDVVNVSDPRRSARPRRAWR